MKANRDDFIRLGELLQKLNADAGGKVLSFFEPPGNRARTHGCCGACGHYGRLRGPIWVDSGLTLVAHWSCFECGSTRVPRGGELHWAQDPFFLRNARAVLRGAQ